tara:strand:- start:309 stop:494 length:186 start_codon:yes stop_codon:yes gene_type:complete
MKHPFKVGDIVETKKHKHRGLVLQTDSLAGGPTIDVFWFDSQNEDILCEVGWFNLISRAEG